MIFDDSPQLDWRQRYMTRWRMNTVWVDTIKTRMRAKNISTDYDDIITVNLDGDVDIKACCGIERIGANGVDICTVGTESTRYILEEDGRVMWTHIDHIPPVDNGWPKCKQLVPSTDEDIIFVTQDNRIYITDAGIDTDRYSDIAAKYISISWRMGAYIDPDDNVWYSKDFRKYFPAVDIDTVEWRPFFGMKGKRVTCMNGVMILIDLEDNLWVYGCDCNNIGRMGVGNLSILERPTRIDGIKGLKVSMDSYRTAVIDINNNLWMFGSEIAGMFGRRYMVNYTNRPIKWDGYKALEVHLGESKSCMLGTRLCD